MSADFIPLRILVCGGRDYQDRSRVVLELDRLTIDEGDMMPRKGTVIIHGACRTGADRWADEWVVVNWCQFEEYPADWSNIERPGAVIRRRKDGSLYDAAAGPFRNQRMIDEGKPDLVVAFPGKDGTADMVRRAAAAGVPTLVIQPQAS